MNVGDLGFATVLGWSGTLTIAHVHTVRAGAVCWREIVFLTALSVGGAALEWRYMGMEGLRMFAVGFVGAPSAHCC